MDTIQDKYLINRKDKTIKGIDLINQAEVIAFLFCEQNSPNIDDLLSKLKDIFEESIKRSLKLDIVFISLDPDEESMMTFFKNRHGNWYAVPFSDNINIKCDLIRRYDVIVNPTIVVVNTDGKIISRNGEIDIMKIGLNVLISWFKF